MKKPQTLRSSWPPSDLRRFSVQFLGGRSTHAQRLTGDNSQDTFHMYEYQSKRQTERQKRPSHRWNPEDGSSSKEHIKEPSSYVKECPSKLSVASEQPGRTSQSISGEQTSADVLHASTTSDKRPQDEPSNEQVEKGSPDIKDTRDDYLQGWRLAMLMISLMLGQLMTSFDGTVITTAIPQITSDFKSLDQVGWYGSAYFMTAMGTQPLFGRAFQQFPTRVVFLVAVALVVVGAILTATAPASIVFIIGRAVTGAAVSAFYAGGATVITFFVPLQRRPIYLSLSMAMNAVASVVGPIISGVLTDSRLTWRFAFWMNLPVAAVVLVMGLPTFRTPKALENSLSSKERLSKLDIPGTILFLIFSGVLVYLLQIGKMQQGPLSSQTIIFILCVFALVVSLALFVYRQYQLGDEASIPFSVISRPTVALCCVYVLLMQTSSVMTYYLPIYYQAAKATSAQTSGVQLVSLLAALSVAQFVSAVVFMMVKGHSSVGAMLLGAMLLATGSGLLTIVEPGTPQATLTAVQILVGLGMGFGTQMPLIEAQRAFQTANTESTGDEPASPGFRKEKAREEKFLPISNGLILLSTFMGLSIGVSVGQAIFKVSLEQNLAAIPDLKDPQVVLGAGAASIGQVVPQGPLQEVVRAAYDHSVRKTFWIPTASASVAVIIILVLILQRRRH